MSPFPFLKFVDGKIVHHAIPTATTAEKRSQRLTELIFCEAPYHVRFLKTNSLE